MTASKIIFLFPSAFLAAAVSLLLFACGDGASNGGGVAAGNETPAVALHRQGRELLSQATADSAEGESADVMDQSESLFRAALEADPLLAAARLDLADLMRRRGARVKAVKVLEEGRKLDPDNPGYALMMARIYLEVDEVDGALKEVRSSLALDPQSADGHFLMGRILFERTKNRESGLDSMRRGLALDPGLPGAAETLAHALTAHAVRRDGAGETDNAMQLLVEAIGAAPDFTPALLERGRLRVKKGALEQGAADLRRVCSLNPGNVEARNLLATTLKAAGYGYLRAREREKALGFFREAVALAAPDVDVTVIMRILDGDTAAESGTGEQHAGPDDSGAIAERARKLFEEGSALLKEGRGGEAVNAFEESIACMPVNPFAHHQLGLALAMTGEPERSEAELLTAVNQAAEMDIDLPSAHVKLAELAFRRGDVEECRRRLDRHDELYPGRADDPAVQGLRALLSE
jgi:tetratricopeptide (TPR) repeat protein